jgi:hypothetical protein
MDRLVHAFTYALIFKQGCTHARTRRFQSITCCRTTGAEVRAGTRATLTCSTSNVLSKGVSVVWKDGDSTLSGDTGQVIDKQQVSKLTVNNPESDKVYTCLVSSNSYENSKAYPFRVKLGVYG